ALLRHPADAKMRTRLGHRKRDVVPIEMNRAGEASREADNGIDERRLAHAIAAEKRERRAGGECQIDVIEHHGLAVARAQALDAQELAGHEISTGSSPR